MNNTLAEEDREGREPDAEKHLKLGWAQLKRATSAYSEEAINQHLLEAKDNVQRCWTSDTWMTELPGKEILDKFRKLFLNSVGYDTLKEQIVYQMVKSDYLPPELERLRRYINSL